MKNSANKRAFFSIFLLIFLCLKAFSAGVSVTDAAERLDLDISWDPLSQELIFMKDSSQVSCKIGESLIIFDNKKADFIPPPYQKDGLTFISSEMYKELETFFSVPQKETKYRVGVILIDPGHGGRDPGCVGSYIENKKTIILNEKTVALNVSLDLYNMLKKAYPDKKILLTRDKDVYPTLEDRVKMANSVKLKKNESILYVSVHVNASLNSKAAGFEVWYLPAEYRREVVDKNTVPKEIHPILNSMMEEEFTMESILMAQNILDGLDAQIGKKSPNRGIRANQWFVVRNVKMPSVLVELGFISNKTEIKLLNSPDYLKKCSLGIYNGLSAFISNFENN